MLPNMWLRDIHKLRIQCKKHVITATICGTDTIVSEETWHVFLEALFLALRKRSPVGSLYSTAVVFAHDANRNLGTTLLPHVGTSL